MAGNARINGHVEPAFETTRRAFEENFRREGDYQEVGASLAVYHRGRLVVDLFGGFADTGCTHPWARDTLINIWSSTKGVVAVAAAMCVDRGWISYETEVAKVWPEFAQAGKSGITFAQLLSHQAGLPGFVEPTTVEDQFDWDGCCAKLARQSPAWAPGTASSYHAMTYGWLVGEVIRRVSDRRIGDFVREEIAKPLDADVYIGLPEHLESRVVEMIAPSAAVNPASLPLSDAARMALINPQQDPTTPNLRAWRAAEIPAANGQATASGLARIYAMLVGGGTFEGARLLSPQAVAHMVSPAAPPGRTDMFLGFTDCWGHGVAINTTGIYGPNPKAFGHSGWGGSFGFADPDAEIAVGYVCNRMGPELVGDPRTSILCRSILYDVRGAP